MSPATIEQPKQVTEVVVREQPDALRPSWIARLRSANHKTIGTTLIGFSLLALVLAGVSELLTAIQLLAPDNTFLPPERFYRLHTLSDVTYLYFFALPGVLGLITYIVPLQIGARTSAFPRLAAFGAWSIVLGGVLFYFSIFINAPEVGVGLPSPLTSEYFSSGTGVDFVLSSLIMVGIGLILLAIDTLTTIANMGARGVRDHLPAFTLAAKAFSLAMLVAAPVLVAACTMLLLERQGSFTAIFDPVAGGNSLLWQILYGWFAHAAPLLIAVAGVGVASEIFATTTSGKVALRQQLGKALTALAALAVLGFGTTLYGAPIDQAWMYVFMFIGLALVFPFTVIVASWLATVRSGRTRIEVPTLYAIGFVVFFSMAMVDAIMLAIPAVGQWALGSQFGYGHWQTLVIGCGMMTILGGLHYWFPKITGRNFSPGPAKTAFALIFVGFFTCVTMLQSLGIDGFARELAEYPDESGYQLRWIVFFVAGLFLSIGVVIALINLVVANARGKHAGNDPWHGGTLEWFAPSPPPDNNFDTVPEITSDTPLSDLRARIASGSGDLAGSVAQPPTAGRPSLRETHS